MNRIARRPSHLQAIATTLKQAVDRMLRSSSYADALYLDVFSRTLQKDKTSLLADQNADHGVKLRIRIGDILYEVGSSSTDEKTILALADKLAAKAQKADKMTQKQKTQEKTQDRAKANGHLDKHFSSSPKIDAAKVTLKKKIKICNDYFAKVQGADEHIINTHIVLAERREEKIFVGPDRTLSQTITGCRMVIMPFVKAKDGSVRFHFEGYFRPGLEVEKVMAGNLKHALAMTRKVRDAGRIRPGKYVTILSPHVTGLLAHESFGHGMEADTMYKDRARARDYLGKRVAPRFVDIVDNPAFPDRNGSFFFDDEGMIAKPAILVEKGVVRQPITDMTHARLLGAPRSANGRCESFDHKSYARMTNTYFGAGRDPAKKMVKSVKDGMYLHYAMGGMEDPKGWGVQIQGIVAERIRNGKLSGEVFYEVGFSGFLPNILANIKAVSSEFMLEGTGTCGKGHKEWVRVSEGGPFLKITNVPLS